MITAASEQYRMNNTDPVAGYRFYQSLSAPSVGELAVLRGEKGDYLLQKPLPSVVINKKQLFHQKLRALKASGLQNVIAIGKGPHGECLYLEFTRKSLEEHLRACREKDMVLAEEDLLDLLNSLTSTGVALERSNEYHPSLTLQNIFRLKDSFKVVHPYIFDACLEESMNTETLERQPSRGSGLSRNEKLKLNVWQTGCVVLAAGILKSEQDIRQAAQLKGLSSLISEFQERYSSRLAEIIGDLLYRNISTFGEISLRIDRKDKLREHSSHVKEAISISPPVDFEGDFANSLAAARATTQSRNLSNIQKPQPSSALSTDVHSRVSGLKNDFHEQAPTYGHNKSFEPHQNNQTPIKADRKPYLKESASTSAFINTQPERRQVVENKMSLTPQGSRDAPSSTYFNGVLSAERRYQSKDRVNIANDYQKMGTTAFGDSHMPKAPHPSYTSLRRPASAAGFMPHLDSTSSSATIHANKSGTRGSNTMSTSTQGFYKSIDPSKEKVQAIFGKLNERFKQYSEPVVEPKRTQQPENPPPILREVARPSEPLDYSNWQRRRAEPTVTKDHDSIAYRPTANPKYDERSDEKVRQYDRSRIEEPLRTNVYNERKPGKPDESRSYAGRSELVAQQSHNRAEDKHESTFPRYQCYPSRGKEPKEPCQACETCFNNGNLDKRNYSFAERPTSQKAAQDLDRHYSSIVSGQAFHSNALDPPKYLSSPRGRLRENDWLSSPRGQSHNYRPSGYDYDRIDHDRDYSDSNAAGDRKKVNRSVSFNLCNSSIDGSKAQGSMRPKSILKKKPSFEDEPDRPWDGLSSTWVRSKPQYRSTINNSSELESGYRHTPQYSQTNFSNLSRPSNYLGSLKDYTPQDDFRIETKPMAVHPKNDYLNVGRQSLTSMALPRHSKTDYHPNQPDGTAELRRRHY